MRNPHPKRKLQAVGVRRILYLKANKVSARRIARMYDIRENQVWNIIHGKTYKEVSRANVLNLKPQDAPKNRWPCKLNARQVRRICECDYDWHLFRLLANEYHVDTTTIYRAHISQTHRR
jgi:hypothetical protein